DELFHQLTANLSYVAVHAETVDDPAGSGSAAALFGLLQFEQPLVSPVEEGAISVIFLPKGAADGDGEGQPLSLCLAELLKTPLDHFTALLQARGVAEAGKVDDEFVAAHPAQHVSPAGH